MEIMSGKAVRTGVVLLNLGGPRTLNDVGPFLEELFADPEIIQLPLQRFLGPFIAKRRTKPVQELYEGIGGGSPILDWTERQGRGMVERLDRLSPETAPHGFYPAFRYTNPTSEEALQKMAADGVERAGGVTQYQQFSCASTGSSLNGLWRARDRLGLAQRFEWSVIDRWPVQPTFIEAMADTVRTGLEQYPESERDDVLLLFSAHSLPLSVTNRGDAYPAEIGASVHEVLQRLGTKNQHLISYQSEVGPVPWQSPSTESVIRELGRQKRKNVLVIGIAFTSDHIETLSELDIEYAELAADLGISGFRRAPALNDAPRFLDALAEIVHEHLASGEAAGSQYALRCPGCVNPQCRNIPNPVAPYS